MEVYVVDVCSNDLHATTPLHQERLRTSAGHWRAKRHTWYDGSSQTSTLCPGVSTQTRPPLRARPTTRL